MRTKGEILTVDPLKPEAAIIDRAVALLADDGVLVAPTETRYGLLARADRQENVERIYKIKQRDLNAPMALFVKDVDMLSQEAELSEAAKLLSQEFLPGPLTLVLKAKSPGLPPVYIGGKIGVRVSSAPIIKALTDRLNCPITATSANRSGRPDPTTIDDAITDFSDEVDLYLDGGLLEGDLSTVVDCTQEAVVILREGALSSAEINRTLRGLN